MWNLCPLEVFKLLASIATPLVIVVFGFIINKTIQRQNAIAQRHSSWLTKWADDFYKAASAFNDSATSFLFLYLESEWKELGDKDKGGIAVDINEISPDLTRSLTLLQELNRGWYEMVKFFGFANDNGKDIRAAASDLLTEARSWHKNGAGDVISFEQKQITFNKNVKKVHAELLGLKDSK